MACFLELLITFTFQGRATYEISALADDVDVLLTSWLVYPREVFCLLLFECILFIFLNYDAEMLDSLIFGAEVGYVIYLNFISVSFYFGFLAFLALLRS